MAKHTSAQIADAFSEITSKFFDYRLFGGVILQGDVDRLLGPVSTQGPWRSIDPVVIDQSTITRMYVQKAGSEGDRNVTMGQQYLVRYAMFRGGIDFYPVHARKTKPTAADLRLLVEALCRCWTTTDPTSQRKMHLRELTAIIHCRSIDDGGVGWRTVDRAAVVTPLGRVAESPSDYEVVSKLTPDDEKIVRVFRFTETSSNAELDAFESALTGADAALDPYAKLPAISFVVHVECSNSNPNGDPDNENKPRHIIRNGADVYAEMTNVCVNRKIKNYLVQMHSTVIAGMPLAVLDVEMATAGPTMAAFAKEKADAAAEKAKKAKGKKRAVGGDEGGDDEAATAAAE